MIASLTRIVRDVGLAEDLAQDALVVALEKWPDTGVQDNPGAWLMGTAKRRAIDSLRRDKLLERKHAEIAPTIEAVQEQVVSDLDEAIDDDIGDDLLRLIFMTCHPVLSTEARVALTLRLLGGLTTTEIARAFLVPEPTIAQRVVRAKKTLSESKVPFEVPRGDDRGARLSSVLEVVYLIFNEGYSATAGDDWMRPALCEEAMRLGRVLAGLAEDEPEIHGGANGLYVLYAEIAACHARASTPDATDWSRIASLYGMLAALTRSPVVELNRAVAVSKAVGPQAGLDIVDSIVADGSLKGYHLLQSVHAELLIRLGRNKEARSELELAAQLTQSSRERSMLLARVQGLSQVRNCEQRNSVTTLERTARGPQIDADEAD